MEVGTNALDLVDGRVSLSGVIECRTTQDFRSWKPLRTWARIASDKFFPKLGNEPSEYVGRVFEFQSGRRNQTFKRHLTRKEALFGEFGEPDHKPLVAFTLLPQNWVIIHYEGLSETDLNYVRKLLPKIGLREIN